MLTRTIDSCLSLDSEREMAPLAESNLFPLNLTFQPFVNDKGCCNLFCKCFSSDIGCHCQTQEGWNAGQRPRGGRVHLVCCPCFVGLSEG